MDDVITNSGSRRVAISVTDDMKIVHKRTKIITMHMKHSAQVNHHKYGDDVELCVKKRHLRAPPGVVQRHNKKKLQLLHEQFCAVTIKHGEHY
jgi:hypothetical protein